MKTHWLYGHGENKEVKFNVEIDQETKCSDCGHFKVCNYDMSKRCANFDSGGNGKDCEVCHHKFTRYDKDAIVCFYCRDFIGKKK